MEKDDEAGMVPVSKQQVSRSDTGGGVPFPLRLRSLKSSRTTYARLLREYGRGNIDVETYKALIWGMAGYLNYLKTEMDADVEERLAALEEKLK